MAINYPEADQLTAPIVRYCLRYAFSQLYYEALRRKYNQKSQQAAQEVITPEEWRTWFKDWFEPRQAAVIEEQANLKTIVRNNLELVQELIDLDGIV